MNRKLRWTLINITLTLPIVLAIMFSSPVWMAVALLLAYITVAMHTLLGLALLKAVPTEETIKLKNVLAVPAMVNLGFDLFVGCLYAVAGHSILGFFFFITSWLLHAGISRHAKQ